MTSSEVAIRDPYSLMDQADEQAMLAEMSGAVVETYIYEVPNVWDPILKRKVTKHQLSKSGVDAVCRETASRGEVIRELEMLHTVDRSSGEAFFRVKAGRYRINDDGSETLLDTAFGVKRQSMLIFPKNGGDPFPNPHWYEHGAMKAARNARRRMIPEAVAVELIKAWSQGGGNRVQRVERDDAPKRGGSDPGPPPEPRARPWKSASATTGTEDDRKAALAEIARELDSAFGDGDPSEMEPKANVLRRIFRLTDWRSLQNMPVDRFMGMYSSAKLHEAIIEEANR